MFGSREGGAHAAARSSRRRSNQRYRAAATGTASSQTSRAGCEKLTGPVHPGAGRLRAAAASRLRSTTATCATPGRREPDLQVRPLGGRGDREPLAQPAVAGVDAQLPARLRIDEPQLADVGQLLLARVAHLDGQDGVPAGEAQQRRPPVERAAEVGDDDHERALRRHAVCELERVAQRAGARRAAARAADGACRAARAGPAAAARRSASAPNAIVPRRLPRRVAA